MSQVPNLDLSKFSLANLYPVFVLAFVFELPQAAREMCIEYGGKQANRIYGLRIFETLGYPGLSCGQFIPRSHGEDQIVSFPSWSCGDRFETAGPGTQRQPQFCFPAFLVI